MEMIEPWSPQDEAEKLRKYVSSLSEKDKNRYYTITYFGQKSNGEKYTDEECKFKSDIYRTLINSNRGKSLQEYLSQFPIKYYDGDEEFPDDNDPR